MYIGNTPAENFASFETQTFLLSVGSTVYNLSHAVTNENDIRLVINNVVQQPGSGKAYTASGTTLTLSSATVSGDVMYAVYLGRALQTVNPPSGSVGTAQLGSDAVTGAKIADDAISDEHLDPTAITGQTAETSIATDDLILLSDTSASGALKKMTRANFVSGIGGTNTPYFNAFSLSGQTLNHATETKKTFTDVTESSSGVFDLSNNKFTVATAGKYFFSFNLLAYDTSNELRRLDIWFKKSGTQKVKFSQNFNNHVGGRDFNVGGSFIFNASANEYFEMFVYQNTGDNGSIELRGASSEQSCYFCGFKLIE